MASDNVFGYVPQVGMDGFVSKFFKIILLQLNSSVNISA